MTPPFLMRLDSPNEGSNDQELYLKSAIPEAVLEQHPSAILGRAPSEQRPARTESRLAG